MDLLQSYSDSDNEAKDDLDNSLSQKQESVKSDYFSLMDSDEESAECDVIKPESKAIIINNTEVDVPEGAFWSDGHSKVSFEKHESYEHSHNDSKNITKNPDIDEKQKGVGLPVSVRRSQINGPSVHESSPFYSTMGNNHLVHKRVAEFESVTDNRFTDLGKRPSKVFKPAADCDQRSMFFIHGKIGPLLNRIVCNRCPKDIETQWSGHNQVINRVQWNQPNYSHLVLSVSMDKTIKIWNAWSSLGSCVKTISCHDKAVKDCVWNPTGEQILSCSYDRSVALVCVKTGNVINRFIHDGYVSCCKYHPSDTNIIITGSTNTILQWDLRTPNKPTSKFHYKEKIGQIQDVIFDQNGRTIFTCSDVVDQNSSDRNIMAWDYITGAVLSNQIYEEKYTCNRLKLHSSDTTQFLAQSQGGYIAIFSTTRPFKMNKRKRFEGHKLQGRSIGFDISNDGDLVISGSCDRKLYCYNYTTGKLLKTISTNLDFTDVAFHPVLPSVVIASSWDGHLQLLH